MTRTPRPARPLAMALALASACAGICALVGAFPPSARAADGPGRPNILFIMADDLGWRDLGCFGSTFHRTPNLDRLAARGLKLTRAYAANPLCSPTRSSVLTGLWPARIGITAPVCHLPKVVLEKRLAPGNPSTRVLVADSVTRLRTEYLTLPEILRDAGYATGHFGKWHLGPDPYSALAHGFDVDWPHWPGPGPAGSYVAPWKFPPDLNIAGMPGDHIEDKLSERVVRFIRENKNRPFFANYWNFSVHAPYDAKAELVARYRPLADPANPQRNPVYAAMVESLDDGVGRVLAALDECGIADRTIVVFFSDNGGISWGGKGTGAVGAADHKSARFPADMTAPPTSNLPLRNGKASLYEGGVREPCIVVWPGVTAAGAESDAVVQSIDWLPTLLEMAGVPMPAAARPDGISVVPALRGGKLSREAIFTHFPHDTPASGQHPGTSVVRGDWKLIRLFAQNDDGTDQLELYNLRDDPGEQANRAADQPELARELNALIDRFLAETEAVIPTRNPNYRPTTARPGADGKARSKAAPPAKASAAADPLVGWKARGCRAVVQDGRLVVEGQGDDPFLGVAAGGPATLAFRARSATGGDGRVEWLAGPADPAGARSAAFRLAPGVWQDVTLAPPAGALAGIIRLHLPARSTPVELDWTELRAPQSTRRADF